MSGDVADYGRFEMLYCDNARCRVNTFEAGRSGKCPGCSHLGEPLTPLRGGAR